ncbi:MAG: hypothetical protein ACRYG2_16130 [Janthinobacterium lividum]
MASVAQRQRKRHGAVFWVLISLLIVLVIFVIVAVLLLLFVPGLADAVFIEWSILSGHAVGGRPQ